MIRFNGLLKSRDAPVTLLSGDKSGFSIKIKSPFVFAAIGTCLALFIAFAISHANDSWNRRGYPSLKLPVASNSAGCIYGAIPLSISWKTTGTWTTEDNLSLTTAELLPFLKKYAQASHAAGREPVIRARIDLTESAQNFIHLTHCMEKAGITNLHIAVSPSTPSSPN